MSFTVIYVTHKNMEEAKKLANTLLQKQYIACANFFPINSSYWWDGELVDSEEVVSLLKTTNENWAELKLEISDLHPYECPCVMKYEVESNNDYEKWINGTVEKMPRKLRVLPEMQKIIRSN